MAKAELEKVEDDAMSDPLGSCLSRQPKVWGGHFFFVSVFLLPFASFAACPKIYPRLAA